jgi:O-antigen/teichoic acid export membrane protein
MRNEVKEIGIVWIATSVSSLFNYIYHLYMARALSPSEYGELFSLLSLFSVASVVFMAIETTVAKFVVEYKISGEVSMIRSLVHPGSLKMAFFGGVFLVVGAPLFVAVADFLRVPSVLVFLLFLSLPLGMASSVYQGVLRGLQRFESLSVMLSTPPVFKLVFGAVLVGMGLGVFGGVLSVFLSTMVALVIGLYLLLDFLHNGRGHTLRMSDMFSYGLFTMTVLMMYTLLTNLDVLLAKHYLAPDVAGEYSALSLMGRMVLFASGAVNIVVFPKFVEIRGRDGLKLRALFKAIAVSIVLSGGLIIVYAITPDFLVGILYGGKYPQITPYLVPYSVGMLFMAVIGVIVNYDLASESRRSVFVLLSVIIFETLAIMMYHSSIGQIVTSFFASTSIGLIISFVFSVM